jgi:hypothetical protein
MKKDFIIKNAYRNDDGLKFFAYFTNNLVRDWFGNSEERELLKRVNCISLDFIDADLVACVLKFNRDYNL